MSTINFNQNDRFLTSCDLWGKKDELYQPAYQVFKSQTEVSSFLILFALQSRLTTLHLKYLIHPNLTLMQQSDKLILSSCKASVSFTDKKENSSLSNASNIKLKQVDVLIRGGGALTGRNQMIKNRLNSA